jgi:uncharacterized protein YgbK (DUF1537 family)
MSTAVNKEALLASLPAEWPKSLMGRIQSHIAAAGQRFVVLDDDPTGGQTLHGMPVLAGWDAELLRAELERSPAFFLLTNSRSLPEEEALALGEQTGRELRSAAEASGLSLAVGSRGDSTLRGHYPAEVHALYRGLTGSSAPPTCIFVPYFGEGGRLTINDTQYVHQGTDLVPVADTEFARDPNFAFTESHLPSWLRARADEQGMDEPNVITLPLDVIRLGGPDEVARRLRDLPEGSTLVANAASDRDLEVLVAGLLEAEAQGQSFVYRTAASFVRVRAGIAQAALLSTEEMGVTQGQGGLIIVGSYVDRTTEQLQRLMARDGICSVELKVSHLLDGGIEEEVTRVALKLGHGLREYRDVVLFTSRGLVRETADVGFHEITQRITTAIAEILRRLDVRPSFVLTKGGSTAHSVATESLGVRRAVVLGQLLPGVPVWRLGEESRFPRMPYVIFPGNVGDSEALVSAVDVLRGGRHAGVR